MDTAIKLFRDQINALTRITIFFIKKKSVTLLFYKKVYAHVKEIQFFRHVFFRQRRYLTFP